MLAVASTAANAQDQTGSRGVVITPGLSISETITNNRNLSSTDRQSDAITQISPSIRISSQTARLQGTLDYALNAHAYARDSSRNTVQNALSASLAAELIERHASVNALASISRQSISAFGVQSSTNSAFNPNRAEVRTYSVSPVLRGNVGGAIDLEARASYGRSTGDSDRAPDSTFTSASVSATGQVGRVGWGLNAGKSAADYHAGRRTTQDNAGGSLNWSPLPDFRLSARAGRESNDVLSVQSRTTSSYGAGVEWQPSERTQLSARADRRYFGNGHNLSFSTRMRGSVWRFADSRDVNSNDGGASGTNAVTAYNNLFAQLASLVPDPLQRDQLVRSLLASQGGFLTNAVTLQRRQDASFALQGLRTSFTASLFRSDTRRLDNLSTALDDLALVDRIRQHGYGVNASYRLPQGSTVNLGYNRTSTADSGAQRGNDQRNFSLSMSTQIALRTSLSLSLRHVVFESVVQPYNESGATATLSFQF